MFESGFRTIRRTGLAVAIVAILAWLPIRSAQAYVDPNTVGPLYQFLFPLLVAIASTFAALRRQIGRLWNRLTGRRARSQSEEPAESDPDT